MYPDMRSPGYCSTDRSHRQPTQHQLRVFWIFPVEFLEEAQQPFDVEFGPAIDIDRFETEVFRAWHWPTEIDHDPVFIIVPDPAPPHRERVEGSGVSTRFLQSPCRRI